MSSGRQRSSGAVTHRAQPADCPAQTWRPEGVQPSYLVRSRSWSAALRLMVVCALATGCTSNSSPRAVGSSPAPVTGTPTSGARNPTDTPTAAPSASPVVSLVPPGARQSMAPPTTERTAGLVAFIGPWSGHTRALTISASGVGHEHVSDGCCDPLLDLTFQLSDVHSSGPIRATATVTAVIVHPGWSAHDSGAPPHLGQQGDVTIAGGVITDHLDHVFYCNPAEQAKGSCGA